MTAWDMPGREVAEWDDPTVPPGAFAQPTGPRGSPCKCPLGPRDHRHAAAFRRILPPGDRPGRNPDKAGTIARTIDARRKARAKRSGALLQASGFHRLDWAGHRAFIRARFPAGLPLACEGPASKSGRGRIIIRSISPDSWDCRRMALKKASS